MRHLIPIWAGSVLTLLALDAVARPMRGVVAPLNPLGIEVTEARKVQRWVTAAMAGVSGYRWLVSKRLSHVLARRKYSDCGTGPACLGAAAREIGADLVVAGDVGSMSGAYMVYLRLVFSDGSAVRSVSGVLDPGAAGLRDAARALAFRLLLPDRYTGGIDVEVDVPNAWIYLDGQRLARSPTGRLKQVSVGTHALRVTHEAYRDYVRFVKVGFNQTVSVQVKLAAFPVGAGEVRIVEGSGSKPLTDSELPWYRRWWAVAGFGAVVLAATTTTVALLVNRSISRDSEVTVRP